MHRKYIALLLSGLFTAFWISASAQTYSGYKVVDASSNMTIAVTVDPTADTVQVIMTGPDSVWFSFGFGGTTMSNLYSYIITGAGEITERKLGNHSAGSKLTSSLKDSSYVSSGGTATAKLKRTVIGLNIDYFDFPASAVTFPIVWGYGVTSALSYPHPNRGASTIKLLEDCIPTNSAISAVSCDTYISPGGNTLTSSGIHFDTLLNAAGCDSVLQINLTILNSSFDTIHPVVCDSFRSPAGKLYKAGGTYMDTLTNQVGCDSFIFIDLIVNYSTSDTINVVSCNEYISPGGSSSWKSSGTYQDTILNNNGCDSVITINLTINKTSADTIYPEVCEYYTSPAGNHTWTNSGIYYDTLINSSGCDSIIQINLTIKNNSRDTIYPRECYEYISPGGSQSWTASGIYFDTLSNSAGCDSFIVINLTIDTADISVNQANELLTANAASASFQWLNCDQAFLAIPGETDSIFIAIENGNYAVQVTQNGCIDTSMCYAVTNVGLENLLNAGFTLHPNPTHGSVHIDFQKNYKNISVILMDMESRVISRTFTKSARDLTLEMGVSPGVYLIRINTDVGSAVFNIVKK